MTDQEVAEMLEFLAYEELAAYAERGGWPGDPATRAHIVGTVDAIRRCRAHLEHIVRKRASGCE